MMMSANFAVRICFAAFAVFVFKLFFSEPAFAQSFPGHLIDLRIEGCQQDARSKGYSGFAQAVIPATMSTICIYNAIGASDRNLTNETLERCRQHLRTKQRAILRTFGEATDCKIIQLNGKVTDPRLVDRLREGDAPVSMQIFFAPTQEESNIFGIIRSGRYINESDFEIKLLFDSGKEICAGIVETFQYLPSGIIVAESYSVRCPNSTNLSGMIDQQIRGMYYFNGRFISILDATLRDEQGSFIRVKSIIPEGAVVFRG
jgi:hypothetical protein